MSERQTSEDYSEYSAQLVDVTGSPLRVPRSRAATRRSSLGAPITLTLREPVELEPVQDIMVDGSVLLPLPVEIATHNQRAEDEFGGETKQLTIVSHSVVVLEGGRDVKLINNGKGLGCIVLNALLQRPDSLVAKRSLQKVGSVDAVFDKLYEDNARPGRLPIMQTQRQYGTNQLFLGLHPAVIVSDERSNPQEALELAQQKLGTVPDTIKTRNGGRFVAEAEMLDARNTGKTVQFDVEGVNKLSAETARKIRQRVPGYVPCDVTITNQSITVDGRTHSNPRFTRLFNELISRFPNIPATPNQLLGAKDNYEAMPNEEYIKREVLNTPFVTQVGINKHGEMLLILNPLLVRDVRSDDTV